MTEQFGLDKKTINKIRNVFSVHPEISNAIVYGSRAKGNYRSASDIDITLQGNNLTLALLNKVELAIDELNLPYSMDLSIYSQIDSRDLIEHINRVGKSILQP